MVRTDGEKMATIVISCSCGAKMTIEDKNSTWCGHRAKEFLEGHYMCRKHGVKKQWEIEDENSDLERFSMAL
jgi:hypothetical protein